jgi:hypothetical protein
LYETSRDRDTVSHQYLVGGTADAGDIYPGGAPLFRPFYQFLISREDGDDIRKSWLVTMDDYIYKILLENPQICGCT